MRNLTRFVAPMCALVALCLLVPTAGANSKWGPLDLMHEFHACFDLPEEDAGQLRVTMLGSTAAGNVFFAGQAPTITFQVENTSADDIELAGHLEVIRYAQRGVDGDPWFPRLVRLAEPVEVPLGVDATLAAGDWQDVTITLPEPAHLGGYAVVLQLADTSRHYVTSFTRTFEPKLERVQHPKQALEKMPPEILARLGIQAIRWPVAFHPEGMGERREKYMARIHAELRELHENKVTVVAEISASHWNPYLPLGRPRPHLDDDGVMKDGKQDRVWLPTWDDEYEQFVYDLVAEFGWPNGPITGFMLWNEPWEGRSISGWQSDMPRYRELYTRMGDAVMRARDEAGVDVLIGGADSTSNTWDKFFAEGIDNSPLWPAYFDFVSVHYQGLTAPVLYPDWNNRKHHNGRVLVWDTESWVANTDDRFLAAVAPMRAAGYDRVLGSLSRIAVNTLSHRRIARDTIRTADGDVEVDRHLESRPLAAAYAASQHFIGEREFREILFKNGLPWVFVFDGLDGNPDDGTVVIVGDIDSIFSKPGARHTTLFSRVRSLDEVAAKAEMRAELAELEPGTPEAQELRVALAEPMPLTNASFTIDAAGQSFRLYDVYGNVITPNADVTITVPLYAGGYFLRADPDTPGSFDALLDALRAGKVRGLEPLEIIAHDPLAPVDSGDAVLRLRLTNQTNEPVAGKLAVTFGDLTVDAPAELSFEPREQKFVDVPVAGTPTADNRYPLAVRFESDTLGTAAHHETMSVNVIARRSIDVEGNLSDWAGVLPQTIDAVGDIGPSFEEAMYLPFAGFESGVGSGFATAYLAADDEHFYFAARVADDSPSDGEPRFAERDQDADFYPAVSHEVKKNGERVEHVWPEGVRRFSYRRTPRLPGDKGADNVLIAFNVIPPDEKDWLTHLPGQMPKFVTYKTTDYQYALHAVAEQFGGGTEVWRLEAPGMPRKHFYPRQPEHPLEGAVEDAQLAVLHDGNTRIVELALPWSEIPHVRDALLSGAIVKFSYRVNHNTKSPDMQLSGHRSVAEGMSRSFHPDWGRHWPNELEFRLAPQGD